MNPEHGMLVCADVLRISAAGPVLFGNRCSACSEIFFPAHEGCTRCGGIEFEDCELGNAGTLWSWTIQGFMPKPPFDGNAGDKEFVPYGVGYVEMPSGIKVESRIRETNPAVLRIGMPMRLVLEPYRMEENGPVIFTYAFECDEGKIS